MAGLDFVDLLDGDNFDTGGGIVLPAEVKHLLCFAFTASSKSPFVRFNVTNAGAQFTSRVRQFTGRTRQ